MTRILVTSVTTSGRACPNDSDPDFDRVAVTLRRKPYEPRDTMGCAHV